MWEAWQRTPYTDKYTVGSAPRKARVRSLSLLLINLVALDNSYVNSTRNGPQEGEKSSLGVNGEFYSHFARRLNPRQSVSIPLLPQVDPPWRDNTRASTPGYFPHCPNATNTPSTPASPRPSSCTPPARRRAPSTPVTSAKPTFTQTADRAITAQPRDNARRPGPRAARGPLPQCNL